MDDIDCSLEIEKMFIVFGGQIKNTFKNKERETSDSDKLRINKLNCLIGNEIENDPVSKF